MFAQRSNNLIPTVVGLIALIFVVKNPVTAANAVDAVISAISTFVSALG